MIKGLLIGTTIGSLATAGLLGAKQPSNGHLATPIAAHQVPAELKETRMTDYTFEFPLESGESGTASR